MTTELDAVLERYPATVQHHVLGLSGAIPVSRDRLVQL